MSDISSMATSTEMMLSLSVPFVVEIARQGSTMDDILALGPGAILELPKPSEDELDILINNKPVGQGLAVKVGENFGLRISHIVTKEDRLQAALGG